MLEGKRISIVSFEFGGANIDSRTYIKDFYYFFRAYDMKLFRITPSNYLFPIASYKDSLEQFGTSNFIATGDY